MAGISPTILVQEAATYFTAKKKELDGTRFADRQEKRRAEKVLQEEMQDIFWENRDQRADLSMRHLMECTMGREAAREVWQDLADGPIESSLLMENELAVDTSAFASITGQIAYTEIKSQFMNPDLIGRNLCTMRTTNFLDGEKIPGISIPSDDFTAIGEAQPYPWVGVGEEYVESPRPVKRGATIGVTREVIIADRTGVLLDRVGQIGKAMAINQEKRILAGVTDTGTATYKRNGNAAVATYSTSSTSTHPFINQASNALQDYTDIENVFLLFDAITDPITNEPIMVGAMDLLVPSALGMTADRIRNATQVSYGRYTDASHVDAAQSGALREIATIGSNPLSSTTLKGRAQVGNVYSSAYVKNATSSASTWFAGNFKQAFKYLSVWDVEVTQVPNSSELFLRDILFALKCGEFGAFFSYEPRYVVKCT
jgi:hypothetical protein